MSIITRDVASHIAKMQLQPKYDAITKRRKEIDEECDKIRLERLPKDIVSVFEKYKGKSDIQFKGQNSELINKFGSRAGLYGSSLPGANYKVIDNDLCEKAISLTVERNALGDIKYLLEETIYNLKTFKKVAEHFPELVEHFPTVEAKKNELVNFSQLREAIK